MKKINLIAVLLLTALVCASCASKPAENAVSSDNTYVSENAELPTAAETMKKIINDEDLIDIRMDDENAEGGQNDELGITAEIYYVQGTYDKFKTQEVRLNDLTPDALVAELSRYNIVPVDTSVAGFEISDENGKKVIELELSKKFSEYIDTMSDEADNAIIASLADTFLKAYDADVIRVMDMDITWCDKPADSLETADAGN